MKNTGFDSWYKKHPNYFPEPSDGLIQCVNDYNIRPGLALDIGCGQGRNALWLASIGFEVTAFDNSEQAIQELLDSAQRGGLSIHAHTADLVTCDLGENLYDLIVVQTTLNHLKTPGSISRCCDKIASALKHRDGFLYCVGFTTEDPGYRAEAGQSECTPFITHYFALNEMAAFFSALECLFYNEYVKLDDSHGLPHIHGKAKLIARRR